MTKVEQWPPPDWEEIVIPWKWVLLSDTTSINVIDWLNASPGGRYHLHGAGDKKDFAFRFENPADATWFRLNLPQ